MDPGKKVKQKTLWDCSNKPQRLNSGTPIKGNLGARSGDGGNFPLVVSTLASAKDVAVLVSASASANDTSLLLWSSLANTNNTVSTLAIKNHHNSSFVPSDTHKDSSLSRNLADDNTDNVTFVQSMGADDTPSYNNVASRAVSNVVSLNGGSAASADGGDTASADGGNLPAWSCPQLELEAILAMEQYSAYCSRKGIFAEGQTVAWRNKTFRVPQVQWVDSLSALDENLSQCLHVPHWDFDDSFQAVQEDVSCHIRTLYENLYGRWTVVPTYASTQRPGAYMATWDPQEHELQVSRATGVTNSKFGSSFQCGGRILMQLVQKATAKAPRKQGFGFIAATLEEAAILVPQSSLDAIKGRNLPYLHCHPDWEQKREDEIRLQVVEAFYGCATKNTSPKIFCERLLLAPSPRVFNIIQGPSSFSQAALDLMTDIDWFKSFLTWTTLQFEMKGQRDNDASGVLQHLCSAWLPEGGFVKNYVNVQLFGQHYRGYQDLTTSSPCSTDTLDPLLDEFCPLLENLPDNGPYHPESCKAIIACLDALKGGNYGAYQPSKEKTFADDVKQGLPDRLEQIEANGCVHIERWVIQICDKYHLGYSSTLIDWSTAIELRPNKGLCLVRTHRGKKMIITRSFFKPYAEETSEEIIFEGIHDEITFMNLLVQSGHMSPEHAKNRKDILLSYLTTLESGVTSYRDARYKVFPKGWLLGDRKNIQSVARQLGIHISDATYIRWKLGQSLARKLLIAHGLMCTGPIDNKYQPFAWWDPEFECPGLPKTPYYPAKPIFSLNRAVLSFFSPTKRLLFAAFMVATKDRTYQLDAFFRVGRVAIFTTNECSPLHSLVQNI